MTLVGKQRGSVLVEIMLAVFMFSTLGSVFLYALTSQNNYDIHSLSSSGALSSIEESFVALRNIRDVNGYPALASEAGTGRGLFFNAASGTWSISSTPDTANGITRSIELNPVTPTAIDALVTITWSSATGRTSSMTRIQRFTDWRGSVSSSSKGGMLVYGNGQSLSDSIAFKQLNGVGAWSPETSFPDVDGTSTDRIASSLKLISSSSRNEKVLISKHQAGNTTYMYGTVWNGVTWNSPFLMTSYGSITSTDQYDATYLANGDFAVVYSTGSDTPNMQVWNGFNWLVSPVVLPSLVGPASPPNGIVLKQRPGTNEMMAVFTTSSGSTQTQYFSGGTYDTGSWVTLTSHANFSASPSVITASFVWSKTDPTSGLLTFSDSSNPETNSHKIWSANGSGSGSWGSTITGINQGPGNTIGPSSSISGASGQYMQCAKANGLAINTGIFCTRIALDGSVSTPAGSPLVATSSTLNNHVLATATEESNLTKSIAVYVLDSPLVGTSIYDDPSNTWTTSPSFVPSLPSYAKSVRLFADDTSSNVMLLIQNGTSDLHTIIWQGSTESYFQVGDRSLIKQTSNANDIGGTASGFAWDIL